MQMYLQKVKSKSSEKENIEKSRIWIRIRPDLKPFFLYVFSNVPDPYVFGPPGPGSLIIL